MMSPAAIAHITNLDHKSIVELAASLVVQLLELLLHFIDSLGRRGSGTRVVLLLAILININVNVVDLFAFRKNRVFVVLVGLASLLTHAALALSFDSFLLLLFSLQLLAKILLLLRRQSFEKLFVVHLVVGAHALAFVGFRVLRLAGTRDIFVTLVLHEFASLDVDLLTEVVSEGACHLHVHLLDVVVLAHFGRR